MIRENLEEREGESEKRGLEAGLVAENGRLKKAGGWQGKGCGDIRLGAGGVADGRRQRSAGEGKRSGAAVWACSCWTRCGKFGRRWEERWGQDE